MDVISKAHEFFETNERYNFYVYDSKNDKVGASVYNDSLEQANENFTKILRRLEPGKYHLKAKKTKGDDANNGLIKMDFVVTQSSQPSKNDGKMDETMLKMIRDDAYERAKFQFEFEQMKEEIKEFRKYKRILEKLAENEKSFLKAVQELTDDDEENDETGAKRLTAATETVNGIMSMFDNFKK